MLLELFSIEELCIGTAIITASLIGITCLLRSRNSKNEFNGSTPTSTDELEPPQQSFLSVKRQQIYTELLESEQVYIQNINKLLESTNEIIRLSKEKPKNRNEISKKQATTLFTNLSNLQTVQLKMLAALSSDSPQNWAKALSNMFNVYAEYAKSYNEIIGLNFDKNVYTILPDRAIQSVLITPIQRPPRYELFADSLLKLNEDDPSLVEFKQAAVELNNNIDQIIEKSEEIRSPKGLLTRFTELMRGKSNNNNSSSSFPASSSTIDAGANHRKTPL